MLIRNGMIYTASDSYKADILISNERIVEIGEKLKPSNNTEIIDVAGCEIFPGGIDAHTHFELPSMGTISADDFESGTIAAACGGTTTIIDFVTPLKGQKLSQAVEARHEKAKKAVVDYGLHIVIVEVGKEILAEIPNIVRGGITSFKCFMAYKDTLMINDTELLEVLYAAKKHGALVSIHAENGDMLTFEMNRLMAEKKSGPQYHPIAHPAEAEGEAAHRAVILAGMSGAPLYIVHLSCNEALEEVKAARSRGQFVLAETCPQYLLLSDEVYQKKGFEPAKWVMSPPLRNSSGLEKIWEGLRDGFIQTVATDHCSFRFKGQKDMGKKNFLKIPNGIPAVGDRMNLLYSFGVNKYKLTRNQFAAVTATNPAKIFGLFPKKGTIAIGSDADLVIFDPKKKGTVSTKTGHHNVDYSAFEGFKLDGMPRYVISRGKIVSNNNKFTGAKEWGKYIKRKTFDPREWGLKINFK